jgi:hypothetical protein
MAREIDFIIVCAEGPVAAPFGGTFEGVEMKFERVSTPGVCIIEVWAASARRPLDSEVEGLIHAFLKFPFFNSHMTTLTIHADDGTFEEAHCHEQN